ncbi:DUF1998 domain-containing protein [Priestia megaterium]|uniref:DUF1998 domain-containing protein n=1 Tax=Priestia megaterium TaxID=1404 RepID=UPI0023DCB495|nr:DUF1998 domain-containing protein [Priestia megaterium]MDF2012301.1 DUF1998 domain-containing protein [Priestia megaterium]
MRYLPMRRSKLVGTEGPGSLVISPEGETAVVGALDFWFRDAYGNEAVNIEEFRITEPRLKAILGVDKFYKPPEFRKQSTNAFEVVPNSNIVMPLMRFPRWHYCSSCKTLKELELDQTSIYIDCPKCEAKRYFKQVPFVVVCEHGHLSDFPWHEWVHRNEHTTCTGSLRIKMSGGTTLDSWQVVCEGCKDRRSLKGVTSTYKDERAGSFLGDNLNSEGSKKYKCEGYRPWCGDIKEECEAPPVAILRNSINVYMSKKISAIAIPGNHSENVDWIISKIDSPAKYMLRLNLVRHDNMKDKISFIRDNLRMELKVNTTDEEIETALIYLESAATIEYDETELENPEAILREKEFEKLIEHVQSESLKIEPEWIYEDEETARNYYRPYLQRLSRVLRLKETIVLYGFDRKDEDMSKNYESYYPTLYRDYDTVKEKWLPAHEVYGEGVFIQLNLEQINKWETNPKVQKYFEQYLTRVRHVQHRTEEILSPRNVMLHTLSHFLIDEFANTSGYNRASIRERLYLGENQVGVLIYTSAGDSEGTLGGLVRLGEKKKFFPLLDQAIMKSEWCSSDPVCTELGESQGQGVNGLNGAACYNCSHIPETSCEHWNRYLDRNLVTDEEIGFFKSH